MATATGGKEDGGRSPHLLRHFLGFLKVFEEDFKEKMLARRLGLACLQRSERRREPDGGTRCALRSNDGEVRVPDDPLHQMG
uniref:Uncharacterized protein n=1 Tax=Oryza glumipatula TaxID=40148 RepID=A0A0E0AIJ7_9ORYZ